LDGGAIQPDGDLSVSSFPGTGSRSGEGWVGDGTTSDTVKLTVWASAEAAKAGGDVVEVTEPASASGASKSAPANAPDFALLESRSSGQCQWTRPLAFVGALSVGEQDEIPCSLTLFSSQHGMWFDQGSDSKWTQKGALFSITRPVPLSVKITVFLAVTQSEPQGANLPPE